MTSDQEKVKSLINGCQDEVEFQTISKFQDFLLAHSTAFLLNNEHVHLERLGQMLFATALAYFDQALGESECFLHAIKCLEEFRRIKKT